MEYILHMSDFHLGRDPEVESERLVTLAAWLSTHAIRVKYLVFTGDIIDAFEISVQCILQVIRKNPDSFDKNDIERVRTNTDELISKIKKSQSLIAEYNRNLLKYSNKKMDHASKVVQDFLRAISVPYDRFIFCCGNHDRLRYLRQEDMAFCCDNEHFIDESKLSADYEPFMRFCNTFNNGMDYHTTLYSHENFHFIIANSNWRAPSDDETNNMCIHCGEVVRLIEKAVQEPNYTREKTILIAHKPFDDICETAKFPYGAGKMLTAKDIIESETSMFLHGDKHSYVVKQKNHLKEFMCGAPLCASDVCYNLIAIANETDEISSTFIRYSKDHWVQSPTAGCLSEAYEISKTYLFMPTLMFLSNRTPVALNWSSAVNLIPESMGTGRLPLTSKLFSSFGDLMVGDRKKIPLQEDNLFEQIFTIVNTSTERRVFNVKGAPGTGKSVFLSLEYLYMLWKFYTGMSTRIPFYIDLDCILNSDRLISGGEQRAEKIVDEYLVQFTNFLAKCVGVGKKYNLPICVIVDGLETKNTLGYTTHTLEDRVFELLENQLPRHDDKYVMGFNDYVDLDIRYTSSKVQSFFCVLYLANVITVPSWKSTQYQDFLSSYLRLHNINDETKMQTFSSTLCKLRRLKVNLSLIEDNHEWLLQAPQHETPWKIMQRYVNALDSKVEKLFGSGREKMFRKAAYLLNMRRMAFKHICAQEGMEDLRFGDFVKIRDNPDVAEYLIAKYYSEKLQTCLEPGASVSPNSILNSFIPRDLGVMIRLVNEREHLSANQMEELAEPHRQELSEMMYSTIVYLIGHDSTCNGSMLIKHIKKPESSDNAFLNFVVRKSHDFALIVCEKNDRKHTNAYICMLMDDDVYRGYHRDYQLRYYQGISGARKVALEGWNGSTLPGKGFDFHDCFLTLVSKLTYCFEKNKPYPLMEVDIFTICDLIYSRLQRPDAERPLFYSAQYNQTDSLCISILKLTTRLLKEYSDQYGLERGIDRRIQAYFEFMHEQFLQVIQILESQRGKDITRPLVSPAYNFQGIQKLIQKPRAEWSTSKKSSSKKKSSVESGSNPASSRANGTSNPPNETIGQHVLECLYIAQMFLPEKLSYEGFNKATVMSLLLMSEVGKVKIGHDYSQQSRKSKLHYEPTEQQGMRGILSLGALDGYANLKTLFEPLTTVGETSDINMTIAREIKLVQSEYKYYTLYDELKIDSKRRQLLEHDYLKLTTSICKDIRSKLISENPDFRTHFHGTNK